MHADHGGVIMECTNCKSDRIIELCAKCSDLCNVEYKGQEHDGYVPDGMGIGGGDYIEFNMCLMCGMVQGIDDLPDPFFYDEDEDEE